MKDLFVSIVVPVRNEERYVERCLYSLAAQDYPRDRFEVLVVDGMSTDRTPELAIRFAAESTLDVRLFQNHAMRTAPGLNIALAAARGAVIIRVDGHTRLAPDYLRLAVRALEDSGADCVGGVIESRGETYAGQAIAIAMSSHFGVGGAAFRIGGEGAVDTVAFGAYRREVFDRVGFFAEDLDKGEDDEFNYRLRDAGGTILLVPRLRSDYTVRDGFAPLWRQYFAYGRAKPEVLRRHPLQARPRQFVPAAFAGALGLALAAALAGRSSVLRMLVIGYTAAATISSLAESVRHGWRYFPPLPLAYACLHVSYGLGFIAGLMGLAGRTLARVADSDARQSTEAPR